MARSPQAILDDFLILEAQRGKPDAWKALVERWHPLLLARAVRLLGDRHLAADAAQDAWLSVARGLPRLQDPARFAPWVYRILARRCVDHIGRRARRRDHPADVSAAPSRPDRRHEPSPDAEDATRLRAAIATLPGEQRILLGIRYAEAIPLPVIADLLGIPEGTVKSRLHTAREALRRVLEPPSPQEAMPQGDSHGRA